MSGEDQINTAKEVTQVVREAAPTGQLRKEAEEVMNREMLATMAEMEAARGRVGDFCVTIGDGDNRTVILTSPIMLVQKTNEEERDYRIINNVTHALYVFARKDGFRAVNISVELSQSAESKVNAPLSNDERNSLISQHHIWRNVVEKGQQEEKELLDMFIRAIREKVGEVENTRYRLGRGFGSIIGEDRNPRCHDIPIGISDITDGEFVIEALKGSIKKRQDNDKLVLDVAPRTTRIATDVAKELQK